MNTKDTPYFSLTFIDQSSTSCRSCSISYMASISCTSINPLYFLLHFPNTGDANIFPVRACPHSSLLRAPTAYRVSGPYWWGGACSTSPRLGTAPSIRAESQSKRPRVTYTPHYVDTASQRFKKAPHCWHRSQAAPRGKNLIYENMLEIVLKLY